MKILQHSTGSVVIRDIESVKSIEVSDTLTASQGTIVSVVEVYNDDHDETFHTFYVIGKSPSMIRGELENGRVTLTEDVMQFRIMTSLENIETMLRTHFEKPTYLVEDVNIQDIVLDTIHIQV